MPHTARQRRDGGALGVASVGGGSGVTSMHRCARPEDEEVGGDPCVGDFGMVTGSLLVSVGLVDRLESEPGPEDGVDPPSQRSSRVRDCERLMAVAHVGGAAPKIHLSVSGPS